jgi:hypothetical protein
MNVVAGLTKVGLRIGWWRVLLTLPSQIASEHISRCNEAWRQEVGLTAAPAGGWSSARAAEITKQPARWGLTTDRDGQLLPPGRLIQLLAPWEPGVNPLRWSERGRLGALVALFQGHGAFLVPLLQGWSADGWQTADLLDQRLADLYSHLSGNFDVAKEYARRIADRDAATYRMELLYPSTEPLRELGYLEAVPSLARATAFGGYKLTDRGHRLVNALRSVDTQTESIDEWLPRVWLLSECVTPTEPAPIERVLAIVRDLPASAWVSEREISFDIFPWLVQAQLWDQSPGLWTSPETCLRQLIALQRARPGIVEIRNQDQQGHHNLFLVNPEAAYALAAPSPAHIDAAPPFDTPTTPPEPPEPEVEEEVGALPLHRPRLQAWLGLVYRLVTTARWPNGMLTLLPPSPTRGLDELQMLLERCPPKRLPVYRRPTDHPLEDRSLVWEDSNGSAPPQQQSMDPRKRHKMLPSAWRFLERWLPPTYSTCGANKLRALMERWSHPDDEGTSQLLEELRELRARTDLFPPRPLVELQVWLSQPREPEEGWKQVQEWTERMLAEGADQDVGFVREMESWCAWYFKACYDAPRSDTEDSVDADELEHVASGEAILRFLGAAFDGEAGTDVSAEIEMRLPSGVEPWEQTAQQALIRKMEQDWIVGHSLGPATYTARRIANREFLTVELHRSGPRVTRLQVWNEIQTWLSELASDKVLAQAHAGPDHDSDGAPWLVRINPNSPAVENAPERNIDFSSIDSATYFREFPEPCSATASFTAALRRFNQIFAATSAASADRLIHAWNALEGLFKGGDPEDERGQRARERYLSALVLHATLRSRWQHAAEAVLGQSTRRSVDVGQLTPALRTILTTLGDPLTEVEKLLRLPGAVRQRSELKGRFPIQASSLGRSLTTHPEEWRILCNEAHSPVAQAAAVELRSLVEAFTGSDSRVALARQVQSMWLDAAAVVLRHYQLRNRIAHDGYGYEPADQPALRRLESTLLPVYALGIRQLAAVHAGADPWQRILLTVRQLSLTQPQPKAAGRPSALPEDLPALFAHLFRAA